MFSNVKLIAGAGVGLVLGAAVVLSWAVFIHGPDQREVGGREMAEKLNAATNEAAKGLENAAEAYRLNLAVCRKSGGVFSNSSGKCEQR
jgi:4-amino-4-deoxy-L-arabinose transferase-like glycosyltransferase